ncbi:MAG: hypothetical protein K0S71_3045 [Clostridia bacterium]|jgi:AAA+ superfamily predicted ATPase|nr:hypothetical protein [Clostridia bacterium]
MTLLDKYFSLDLTDSPYKNSISHLEDMLSLIKLYLACFELLSAKNEIHSELPGFITLAWKHILSREEASEKAHVHLPLIDLSKTLRLSFYEYLCLLLAVSPELDEGLCKTYTQLCGFAFPTFHLGMCLYGMTEPITKQIFMDSDLTKSPLKYVLFHEDECFDNKPLMRHPLCIQKTVMLHLTGTLSLDDDYCTFFDAHCNLELAPIHTYIEDHLSQHLSTALAPCTDALRHAVILTGIHGVGKKTIIKSVCKKLSLHCIFVKVSQLRHLTKQEQSSFASHLAFKLLLSESVLCLDACNEKENTAIYEHILTEITPLVHTVFLCFEKPLEAPFHCNDFHTLDIPVTAEHLKDRIVAWSYMAQKYHLSIAPKLFASKYDLTIGQLEKVIKNCILLCQYNGDTEISEKHLVKAILATNKMSSNTYLVKHKFTFKDLVLDDKTLSALQRICSHVKYRYTVLEDWNFSDKLAYGKGLSMLFYGAPGTGKTMCASVLANEWGLDLIKVDLSQVVDKYIGETEKRLDAIFTSAKQNNCVLFFDEADALFSKRTDINSSNDKYANIEVSHLLQKIELYDGIVILATNLVQNFDDAFKRRIHFMLRFNMPTPDIRKELWVKAFPTTAPLGEDIDFDLLAARFELSPSIIKSTALYSAFLAADAGTNISMQNILEGIRYEYEKTGKIMPFSI